MDWSDYSIHGRFEELVSLFESSFSRLYASLSGKPSESLFRTSVAHVALVPESAYDLETEIDRERKQTQFYVTLCDLCGGVSPSTAFNGISSRISLLGCGSYSRDPLLALPSWFGEPKFLLIRGAMSVNDPINGRIEIQESTSKRLLAAATIALSNVREQGLGKNSSMDYFDQIPIFVQVHSLARRCFIGRRVSQDNVMEFATDGKHIRSRWSAEPPSHFGDGVCIGLPWHLSTLESVIRNFAGRIYITPNSERSGSPSLFPLSGSLPLSTLAANLNLSASIALSYRVVPKVASLNQLSNLPIVSTVEVEAAWFAPHTSFGSINRLPLSAEGATPSQLLAAQVLSVRVHWAENTSITRTRALKHLNNDVSCRVSKSLARDLLMQVKGLNDPTAIDPAQDKQPIITSDSSNPVSLRPLPYFPLNVLLASTLRTSRQPDSVRPSAPVAACPIAAKIAVLAFALECSHSLVSEARENEVEDLEWKRRLAAQARSRPPSASPGFVASSASLNSYASSDDEEEDLAGSANITSSNRIDKNQDEVDESGSKKSRKNLKRALTEAKAAATHSEPVAFDLGAEDLALLADVERKYSIDLMTTQSSLQSPSVPHFKTLTSSVSSPNETTMQVATSSTSSSSSYSIARRLLKSVSSAQVLLGGARAVAGLVHDPARFISLSDVHYAVKSAINAALYTNASLNDDTDLLARFSTLTSRLCVNVLTASLPSVRLAQARESNLILAAHYNGESSDGVTSASSSAPPPPSPDMFGLSSRFPGGLIEWACASGDSDDSETLQRMAIVRNITLRTVCICWASFVKELRTHWVEARNGVTSSTLTFPQFSSQDALNVLIQSIKNLTSSKKSEKDNSNAAVQSESLLRGDAALIMLERMGIIAVTVLLMNASALLVVDQVSDTASRIHIGSQPHVFSQGTDESRATLSHSELISNLFSSGLAALGGRFRGVAARIEELSESLALDSKSSEQTRMLLDSGFSFELSPESSIRYEMPETSTTRTPQMKRVNVSERGSDVMHQVGVNSTRFGVPSVVLAATDVAKASNGAMRAATTSLTDACCLLISTCADLETYIQRLQWLSSCFPQSLTLALSDGLAVEYHRDTESETIPVSTGDLRIAPVSEAIHSLVDGRRVSFTNGDDSLMVLEGGGAARQGKYQDGTEHSLLITAETIDEKKAVVALLNASHPSDGGGVEKLASDEVCFLLESSLPRYIDSETRTNNVDDNHVDDVRADEVCTVLHRAVVRVDSIGARVSMQLSECL